MGEWYSVMVLRKYFIAHLPINKEFNIEEISGMKFEHPEMIVSFLNLVSNSLYWDANIAIEGEYPKFHFSYDALSISEDSIIQLLIMEGDY